MVVRSPGDVHSHEHIEHVVRYARNEESDLK